MKIFFNIWNNFPTLMVVGIIFFVLACSILAFDPRFALEIFALPFVCFLRAAFVKLHE